MQKIRVVIVDDNFFLAKSIEKKIHLSSDQISVVLVSEGHKPIVDYLENGNSVDVILMDIEMPELDGIALTKLIKEKYQAVCIIMLTVFDENESIFNSIMAGASGYLLKDTPAESLIRAIHNGHEGGSSMTPSIAKKTLEMLRNPRLTVKPSEEKKVSLTLREVEVLDLLKTGLTYKRIGEALHLSEGTIRKHVEHIYKKLHAHNKLEAIGNAKKLNII